MPVDERLSISGTIIVTFFFTDLACTSGVDKSSGREALPSRLGSLLVELVRRCDGFLAERCLSLSLVEVREEGSRS